MAKYIYRDLISMVRYLPYGLVLGIPVAALLLWVVNRGRRKENREPAAMVPVAAFGMYLVIMMIITFLSRESGSRGSVDLELFSTWGINDRNNAYVVENVLLFIPYGFLGCWFFDRAGKFLSCMVLGTATSLGIECLQLATGRGYFQIDDILTNTLGTIIGFLIFRLMFRRKH